MNKFLIILFFITGSAFAEIVTVTGEHQHLRDISIKEGFGSRLPIERKNNKS